MGEAPPSQYEGIMENARAVLAQHEIGEDTITFLRGVADRKMAEMRDAGMTGDQQVAMATAEMCMTCLEAPEIAKLQLAMMLSGAVDEARKLPAVLAGCVMLEVLPHGEG
jgi:hypothetical protein